MLLTGVLLGPPSSETTPGHPIEIEWSAPASCPDAEWAHREVERFVGDSLAQTRTTQLSFEVSITPEPAEGWVANIVTITEGGRRRRVLPHSDCERLSEAVALIIAMAIDPAAIDAADESALGAIARARTAEDEPPPPESSEISEQPESTSEESDSSSPEPEPPPTSSPPTSPPRPPGRFSDRWAGPRLAFDAGVGRLPTVDLGGTAGASIGVGPLRFDLLGGIWAPRSVPVQGDATTHFWAWSVALRLGWAFAASRRVDLPLMVGVDLGQVRAQGRGLQAATEAAPPIGHAHLVPGVQIWLGPRVGLVGELDIAVPWARPQFTVEGAGTVFRSGPIAVHAGVGLLVRFPRRMSSR